MNLQRRQLLGLAAGAASVALLPRIAVAQPYPSRPVRLVAAFPAGGTSDIISRLVGKWLSERLGQPVVVENRPGAGANIGTEAVVRAPPDGYTLLMVTTSNTVSPSLYERLNYNFIRDISPVATVARVPIVMEVNPSFPVKTVPEFIAYAKARSGKINMASGGNGGSGHMSGELFMMMTGVNLVHVPYRGAAPALADLLGGQVDVMFDQMTSSIGYIRAGQLRALGVATAARVEMLPEVPAVCESVPGYEASSWYGIGAPRKTPVEIVERLNREINAALADHKLRARLADLGAEPLSLAPNEFEKFVIAETEKWGKVVKTAGIKAD
jgi:tripartite-type tricarboxylate transporter receptor subunit TctC